MTRPDMIRRWAVTHFPAPQVDRIVGDLIDVATGNRAGNHFEQEAVARIFPECPGCQATKGPGPLVCWDCFKGRGRGRPALKYFQGTFAEWLAL